MEIKCNVIFFDTSSKIMVKNKYLLLSETNLKYYTIINNNIRLYTIRKFHRNNNFYISLLIIIVKSKINYQ